MNNQKIEFVNGSSITIIPTKTPNQKFSTIGVDVSNGDDFSCVAYRCGSCNSFLGAELFKPNEDIHIIGVKKCSKCGAKFKRYYLFK